MVEEELVLDVSGVFVFVCSCTANKLEIIGVVYLPQRVFLSQV